MVKNKYYLLVLLILVTLGTPSCKLWNKMFNREAKRGCPTDGRNVGAEQLLTDRAAEKKSKKAKFRGGS
jgi:hypothetical protein